MTYLRNGQGLAHGPFRLSMGANLYAVNRANATGAGRSRAIGVQSALARVAGRPAVYESPGAWVLPVRGGNLGVTLEGPQTTTLALSAGLAALASMTSAGTLTAPLSALARMAIALVSDGVTSGSVTSLSALVSSMLSAHDCAAAMSSASTLAASLGSAHTLDVDALAIVIALVCALESDGSVTLAECVLVATLTAALASSGALSADVTAAVQMTAAAVSAGDLTAALVGISHLEAALVAPGAIAGDLRGLSALSATLTTEGTAAELTAADIARAVWDEALAAHADAGSTGEALARVQSIVRTLLGLV